MKYCLDNGYVQDWQYAAYQDDEDEEGVESQEDQAPDPDTIAEHRRLNPKVTLNVGGRRHEIMWSQLEKKPLTRLGRLARAKTHEDILELADGYSLANNEIYYDRDPAIFNTLLNFYRTNRLHLLDEICVLDYEEELDFWMVQELRIEICCIDKFTARRDAIVEEIAKEKAFGETEEEEEDFGKGYFTKYQKCLWDLMEKPQSSLPAKVLSLISIGLVLVSLIGMCLNTFKWLQSEDVDGNLVDNPKLALIELICIAYFSVEFLLRLAGAPQKLAFLKSTMNIVDVAAILPYYITLFFMPEDNFGQVPPLTTETPSLSTSGLVRRLLQEGSTEAMMTTMEAEAEAEESGFGNFSRIMQVISSVSYFILF